MEGCKVKQCEGIFVVQASGEGTYRDRSEDGREGADFNVAQGNLCGNPISSFCLENTGFSTAYMV